MSYLFKQWYMKCSLGLFCVVPYITEESKCQRKCTGLFCRLGKRGAIQTSVVTVLENLRTCLVLEYDLVFVSEMRLLNYAEDSPIQWCKIHFPCLNLHVNFFVVSMEIEVCLFLCFWLSYVGRKTKHTLLSCFCIERIASWY